MKASNIGIDVQSSDAGPPRLVIVTEADCPPNAVYLVTWNWPLLSNTVVGAASRVRRNDVGSVLKDGDGVTVVGLVKRRGDITDWLAKTHLNNFF